MDEHAESQVHEFLLELVKGFGGRVRLRPGLGDGRKAKGQDKKGEDAFHVQRSKGFPEGAALTTQRSALTKSRFCVASEKHSSPWPMLI